MIGYAMVTHGRNQDLNTQYQFIFMAEQLMKMVKQNGLILM